MDSEKALTSLNQVYKQFPLVIEDEALTVGVEGTHGAPHHLADRL